MRYSAVTTAGVPERRPLFMPAGDDFDLSEPVTDLPAGAVVRQAACSVRRAGATTPFDTMVVTATASAAGQITVANGVTTVSIQRLAAATRAWLTSGFDREELAYDVVVWVRHAGETRDRERTLIVGPLVVEQDATVSDVVVAAPGAVLDHAVLTVPASPTVGIAAVLTSLGETADNAIITSGLTRVYSSLDTSRATVNPATGVVAYLQALAVTLRVTITQGAITVHDDETVTPAASGGGDVGSAAVLEALWVPPIDGDLPQIMPAHGFANYGGSIGTMTVPRGPDRWERHNTVVPELADLNAAVSLQPGVTGVSSTDIPAWADTDRRSLHLTHSKGAGQQLASFANQGLQNSDAAPAPGYRVRFFYAKLPAGTPSGRALRYLVTPGDFSHIVYDATLALPSACYGAWGLVPIAYYDDGVVPTNEQALKVYTSDTAGVSPTDISIFLSTFRPTDIPVPANANAVYEGYPHHEYWGVWNTDQGFNCWLRNESPDAIGGTTIGAPNASYPAPDDHRVYGGHLMRPISGSAGDGLTMQSLTIASLASGRHVKVAGSPSNGIPVGGNDDPADYLANYTELVEFVTVACYLGAGAGSVPADADVQFSVHLSDSGATVASTGTKSWATASKLRGTGGARLFWGRCQINKRAMVEGTVGGAYTYDGATGDTLVLHDALGASYALTLTAGLTVAQQVAALNGQHVLPDHAFYLTSGGTLGLRSNVYRNEDSIVGNSFTVANGIGTPLARYGVTAGTYSRTTNFQVQPKITFAGSFTCAVSNCGLLPEQVGETRQCGWPQQLIPKPTADVPGFTEMTMYGLLENDAITRDQGVLVAAFTPPYDVWTESEEVTATGQTFNRNLLQGGTFGGSGNALEARFSRGPGGPLNVVFGMPMRDSDESIENDRTVFGFQITGAGQWPAWTPMFVALRWTARNYTDALVRVGLAGTNDRYTPAVPATRNGQAVELGGTGGLPGIISTRQFDNARISTGADRDRTGHFGGCTTAIGASKVALSMDSVALLVDNIAAALATRQATLDGISAGWTALGVGAVTVPVPEVFDHIAEAHGGATIAAGASLQLTPVAETAANAALSVQPTFSYSLTSGGANVDSTTGGLIHADAAAPGGSAVVQILATVNGVSHTKNVTLTITAAVGGGSGLLDQSFVAADDSLPPAPTVGSAGAASGTDAWKVFSNRLHALGSAGATDLTVAYTYDLGTDQVAVTVDNILLSGSNWQFATGWTDANNFIRIAISAAGLISVWYVVAGTWNYPLDGGSSVASSFATGDTFGMRRVGTTLTIQRNGVDVAGATVTASDLPTGHRHGPNVYQGNSGPGYGRIQASAT